MPAYHRSPFAVWVLLWGGLWVGSLQGEEPPLQPRGDCEIRARLLDSEIVMRTTTRTAGAIDSVRWRGQEFIDTFDHGRQLQSASNFDAGSPFLPETFNPTEAGSVADGAGPVSSSRLLQLLRTERSLQTTTQMAFWLPPGGQSLGHPTKNSTRLSNHLLTKRVQLGYRDLPQVIVYDVTFSLPIDEQHTFAQFEVVTGYMPAEFERFLVYDPAREELREISDGPGEQALPVVLATADGQFAMGCYTPETRGSGWSGPGYGRFRFPRERVTKWNCVWRYTVAIGVPPGDYSFRTFVILGDQTLVQAGLRALMQAEHP